MASKKIVITAGGTGGHLYPAQALAQQLMKQSQPQDFLFMAGGLKSNRHFDRESFPYHEVASSPLISRNPLKCLRGLKNLIKGFSQSVKTLKTYRPDLVVGFGSFYTVPVLLAAKWLGIPIVLHEANSIPGKANRWLAGLAHTVAIHFPSTASYFKGKSIVAGLPLREGYGLGLVSKEKALAYYGLVPGKKNLLIFGGSQGAQAINRLMRQSAALFQKLSLQIIHFTGDAKIAEELSVLYAQYQVPACVKPYENQMVMAWSAADAFVGRSGAATIAEAIEFEIPGILIPYPFATDNHQEKNADFLVEDVGLAWKLLEETAYPVAFEELVAALFQPKQLETFKTAVRTYKKLPYQTNLCELVLSI